MLETWGLGTVSPSAWISRRSDRSVTVTVTDDLMITRARAVRERRACALSPRPPYSQLAEQRTKTPLIAVYYLCVRF